MQIEIKDETLKFLKDLMHRYVTQDSRGTAKPYYFVVNTTREMAVWAGATGASRYRYYDYTYTEKELRAYCKEHDLDFDVEAKDAIPFDVQEIDEYHNFFLTKEGYDEHMKLNEHNYRHFKGSPRSYIMYANRNPEIDGLLKALCEITGEEYK